MLTGTNGQVHSLTVGTEENPATAPGGVLNFMCNTIPDRSPTGPLAYYIPLLVLSFYASLVQVNGGSAIQYDRLDGALLDTINWTGAFHGTPISSDHVFGIHMPMIERYTNGTYLARRRELIPAAAGTYPVERHFAVLPSVSRVGGLESETSQLAAMFKTSNLKINVAAADVLTALSTGATFTGMSVRASVLLVPRSELVLGTPVETILTQITNGGGTAGKVTIQDFGVDTMLTGVESKGGVAFLAELSSVNGQGGRFLVNNVNRLSFPWRGQEDCQHVEAMFLTAALDGDPSRQQAFPTSQTGGDSEMAGAPYTAGNSNQSTTASTHMDLTNALGWFFVRHHNGYQLSDLQTADGDQYYNLGITGGRSAGLIPVLGMYARQWTPQMRKKWLELVTDGGPNSLASYVLGGQDAVNKAQMVQRTPRGKHLVTVDQTTYLPWQLAPVG
jgi:hypothetical protein